MRTISLAGLGLGLALSSSGWAGKNLSCIRAIVIGMDELKADNERTSREWTNDAGLEDWNYDGGSYDDSFAGVTHQQKIDSLAQQRRAAGKSARALDIGGSGFFTESPHIYNHILGFRYGERAPGKDTTFTTNVSNRQTVLGNAFETKGWAKVDAKMEEAAISDFDFIFIRTHGPMIGVLANATDFNAEASMKTLFHRVLNNGWRRLSSDGGELFTEMPGRFAYDSQIKLWMGRLREAGITVYFDEGRPGVIRPALRIIRHRASPELLPP